MDGQAGKERDLGGQILDFQSVGGLQTLEKNVIVSIENGDRTEKRNA